MTRPSFSRAALAMVAMVSLPITAYAAAEPASKQSDYYTKKTCSVDLATGSRLGGVRRCRSKAEKDEMKAQAKQTTDRIQTLRPTMCPPSC